MEMLFASAFTIGLLGSLHCIGMCGGLVSAITISRDKMWWPGLLSYQFARIASYIVLGIIVASIGVGLQSGSGLQSIQIGLGYFAAGVMILFALNLGGWLPDPLSRLTASIMGFTGLGRWTQQANQQDKLAPWLMVGLLNGLLPCGLVYAGLALSLTAQTPLEGGLVMLAFGLGTLPAMVATPYLMRSLTPQLRGVLLKVAAIALIILALFTATRHLMHGEHNHGTMEHGDHSEQHMPAPTPAEHADHLTSHPASVPEAAEHSHHEGHGTHTDTLEMTHQH